MEAYAPARNKLKMLWLEFSITLNTTWKDLITEQPFTTLSLSME